MQKWNLLKKTAPCILSLAVAATTFPTAVMASDLDAAVVSEAEAGDTEDFSTEETAEDTEAVAEEAIEDAADITEEAAEDAAVPEAAADETEDIQQRATTMLRDVHYVIEAHFEMTDQDNASDNPGKFQDIIKRRLRRGQAYSQPYLGTRECTAHFGLWEGGSIPTISETRDLGLMLYDMDFSDPNDIQPMFFRAKLENGVLDLTNCEVIK